MDHLMQLRSWWLQEQTNSATKWQYGCTASLFHSSLTPATRLMVELKANFWSRSQQDEGFNHCRMLDKSYPIKAASAQARPDVPLKLHQQKKKKKRSTF